MKRQIERIFRFHNAFPGRAKKEHQRTGAYEPSDCARFRKDLDIIVVCVIHDGAVVERGVSRKDVFKGTESSARHRMVNENSPGVSEHLGAAGLVHFQFLVSLKSAEGPASAEPN